MITFCTHPGRCAELEQAHGNMAAQLADALGTVQQLRAQLVQAQAAAHLLKNFAQRAKISRICNLPHDRRNTASTYAPPVGGSCVGCARCATAACAGSACNTGASRGGTCKCITFSMTTRAATSGVSLAI